jgi:hypothetical protein
MTARRLIAIAAAAGLALAPLASDARVLRVPTCGGGVRHLILPTDPAAPPRDENDCAKACHAVTERRDRLTGKRSGCC